MKLLSKCFILVFECLNYKLDECAENFRDISGVQISLNCKPSFHCKINEDLNISFTAVSKVSHEDSQYRIMEVISDVCKRNESDFADL